MAIAWTVERLERMEVLFHAASALPAVSREAFLKTETAGDADMLTGVLDLLAADEQAAALTGVAAHDEHVRPDGWLGEVVGAFRIEALAGTGGMGRVYRAERADGSMQQTVAIKMIGMAMPSPATRAAFLQERDSLARLQHRGIARLVDAGLVDGATPWLAMEFVEGRRLDVAADDTVTRFEDVLRWGMELCDAVGYAHRNLLLHRDIKPANVAVTPEGTVRLLDFGTARLLEETGAPASDMTQPGMRALTVRYASPEQLGGEAVSVASDIFSIGMTLYRSFSGRLPAALDDLPLQRYLAALREEPYAAFVADLRSRWPGLTVQRARDLAAVLQKCLRHDAAARYRDAAELSEELRRVLEKRPVQVAPPSRAVRAAIFVRRHRTALALGVASAVLLAVGVGFALQQTRVARVQRARADAGLSTERGLTHFLLADYFDQLKTIPGSTAAQREAVTRALAYTDGLASVAGGTDLELDRVQAYTGMGSLLGNPYTQNLEDTAGAERTLKQAVALGRELALKHPDDLRVLQARMAAEVALGSTYFATGHPKEAAAYLLPAAEESKQVAARPGIPAAVIAQAAVTIDTSGDLYGLEGSLTLNDVPEALRRYREALRLHELGAAHDSTCMRCRRGVVIEYMKIVSELEEPSEIIAMVDQALASARTLPLAEQTGARVLRLTVLLKERRGTALLRLGREEEGLALMQASRARELATIAADPLDAQARYDLYQTDFNTVEAITPGHLLPVQLSFWREMLKLSETLISHDGNDPRAKQMNAESRFALGSLLKESGDASGKEMQRDAVQDLVRMASATNAEPLVCADAAEALVTMRENGAAAERLAQKAMAGVSQRNTDAYHLTLAEAAQLAGDTTVARTNAQEALRSLEQRTANPERDLQRRRALAVLR